MRNKNIVLELDERYFNKRDLSIAVLKYYCERGKICDLLDMETIVIEDIKYSIIERNFNIYAPIQQIILKAID